MIASYLEKRERPEVPIFVTMNPIRSKVAAIREMLMVAIEKKQQ